MVWLCDGKNFLKIFIRFDRINACDGQTDGQTPYDGIDCTYA